MPLKQGKLMNNRNASALRFPPARERRPLYWSLSLIVKSKNLFQEPFFLLTTLINLCSSSLSVVNLFRGLGVSVAEITHNMKGLSETLRLEN